MKEVAQRYKDAMPTMNTYNMDVTMSKLLIYLHHDDQVRAVRPYITRNGS